MNKLKLAVLISGNGTTYQTVHDACTQGALKNKAEIVLVIASRRQINGVERALNNGMKMGENLFIIRPKSFSNQEKFGLAMISVCQKQKPDLILQLGWMVLTPKNVIEKYQGKIINQHPGPIEFGGQGMHGLHVHAAVLKFNQLTNQSGAWATNHLVDPIYDHGEIVAEKHIITYPDDTPEKLAQRILPQEHQLIIETIKLFIAHQGNLPLIKRKRLGQDNPREAEALRKAISYGKNYQLKT